MSRKRWGRSVVDILKQQLGVAIKPEDEARVAKVKDEHPEITTGDILVQLDIAPAEAVREAEAIAKREGSCALLLDRFREAKVSIQSAADASRHLAKVAVQIAKKG